MASKSREQMVIWTVNIDKKKNRSQGRKIPRKKSVSNVKLSEMVQACQKLGIKCISENKKYPKCWWEETGRIIVPKSGKKTDLMIEIAQKIAELRETKDKKKK
ncbi:MAG TPA: signal recognition particle protein Srp19 [Archaeoglobaceae archaeon]|nr:signal recognition particle protein Srp19 [Archaeoglobaceae archaeon]